MIYQIETKVPDFSETWNTLEKEGYKKEHTSYPDGSYDWFPIILNLEKDKTVYIVVNEEDKTIKWYRTGFEQYPMIRSYDLVNELRKRKITIIRKNNT